MTFNECVLKIGAWIEDRNVECMIASDAPGWDCPHLDRLLKPLWPANLLKHQIDIIHVPHHIEEDLVLEFDYDVHNALDDAMVMKKASDLQKILKY